MSLGERRPNKWWTETDTFAMLTLIEQLELVHELDKKRQRNDSHFRRLRHSLAKRHIHFTVNQIRNRWKSLKHKYRKIKTASYRSPAARLSAMEAFRYFRMLDRMLAHRPRAGAGGGGGGGPGPEEGSAVGHDLVVLTPSALEDHTDSTGDGNVACPATPWHEPLVPKLESGEEDIIKPDPDEMQQQPDLEQPEWAVNGTDEVMTLGLSGEYLGAVKAEPMPSSALHNLEGAREPNSCSSEEFQGACEDTTTSSTSSSRVLQQLSILNHQLAEQLAEQRAFHCSMLGMMDRQIEVLEQLSRFTRAHQLPHASTPPDLAPDVPNVSVPSANATVSGSGTMELLDFLSRFMHNHHHHQQQQQQQTPPDAPNVTVPNANPNATVTGSGTRELLDFLSRFVHNHHRQQQHQQQQGPPPTTDVTLSVPGATVSGSGTMELLHQLSRFMRNHQPPPTPDVPTSVPNASANPAVTGSGVAMEFLEQLLRFMHHHHHQHHHQQQQQQQGQQPTTSDATLPVPNATVAGSGMLLELIEQLSRAVHSHHHPQQQQQQEESSLTTADALLSVPSAITVGGSGCDRRQLEVIEQLLRFVHQQQQAASVTSSLSSVPNVTTMAPAPAPAPAAASDVTDIWLSRKVQELLQRMQRQNVGQSQCPLSLLDTLSTTPSAHPHEACVSSKPSPSHSPSPSSSSASVEPEPAPSEPVSVPVPVPVPVPSLSESSVLPAERAAEPQTSPKEEAPFPSTGADTPGPEKEEALAERPPLTQTQSHPPAPPLTQSQSQPQSQLQPLPSSPTAEGQPGSSSPREGAQVNGPLDSGQQGDHHQ